MGRLAAFDAAKAGHWARDEFRGHQLSGKTLGILGYGRLGRMAAEYGKAFRMRVLACDVRKVEPAEGVEIVDFERLLRESDVLSIHIHLTEENRGLINTGAFAMLKPGAVLINTSRGAIVDEQAFLEALLSGRLAGAGVDVIEGEWNENLADHPLIVRGDVTLYGQALLGRCLHGAHIAHAHQCHVHGAGYRSGTQGQYVDLFS